MKIQFYWLLVFPVLALAQSPEATPTPSPYTFSGDFRFRHQTETKGTGQERMIQRIQARVGVSALIAENLKATVRLMSGNLTNSGNQTLGDDTAPGMPRRSFGIDLAFLDYKPVTGLNLFTGKMTQPFTFAGKNQMLLDRDITLEGLGAKGAIPFTEDLALVIQGGTFWIRENFNATAGVNQDQADNFLNAAQIVLQWKPENYELAVGAGRFVFTGVKDSTPANLSTQTGTYSSKGNTLSGTVYANNYDVSEYLADFRIKWDGDWETGLFYENLKNTEATTLEKATAYGLAIVWNSLTLTWLQQEVEKDSVLGIFTDSDFAAGNTSAKGSVYSLAWKITKKTGLQYTYFDNKTGIDATEANYKRQHLDLTVSF